MISKDEYVRKMHSKLDQLSNEIDRMVDKRERIEEAGRAEFANHLENLQRRRDEVREGLQSIQQAGENAWEDMQSGLELAWEAIAQALDSARNRFK
jgi:ParB-like chromosome segregation protein Spo0J